MTRRIPNRPTRRTGFVPYNHYDVCALFAFPVFEDNCDSLRYEAYIIGENAIFVAAAKYIIKYTHKGHDRATIDLQL